MAFVFSWPEFEESFYNNATRLLDQALNKGDMPPIIADTITVKELDMGTIPPELEILEIGELTTDRFRGIFRLSYSGDASIELKTRIQANPLANSAPSHPLTPNAAPLFAAAPLIVPMTLKLSSLQLRAILTLVISRQKGITLVVKNDALESLHVSSSFDSITAIQSFIQKEIESKVKELIRSDLPNLIHHLSQNWLAQGVGKAAGLPVRDQAKMFDENNANNNSSQNLPMSPSLYSTDMSRSSSGDGAAGSNVNPIRIPPETPKLHASARSPSSSSSPPSFPLSPSLPANERPYYRNEFPSAFNNSNNNNHPSSSFSTSGLSVPESIESFDPTYGMRPNSLPAQSAFNTVLRLWKRDSMSSGLKDAIAISPPTSSFSSPTKRDRQRHTTGSESLSFVESVDGEEDDNITNSTSSRKVPMRYSRTRHKSTEPLNGRNEHDDSWVSIGVRDLVVEEGEFGMEPEEEVAYERIPAVGGGTITRPRVFHSSSQIFANASPSLNPSSSSASNLSATAGSTTVHGESHTATSTGHYYPSANGGAVVAPSHVSPRYPLKRQHSLPAYTGLRDSASDPMQPLQLPSALHGASRQCHAASDVASGSSRRNRYFADDRRSAAQASSDTSPNTRTSTLLEPSTMTTTVTSPSHSSPSPTPSHGSQKSSPYGSQQQDKQQRPRSPPPLASHNNAGEGAQSTLSISPSKNDSCAHLATLTHSHHTLSPYTRSMDHFMSRSFPRARAKGTGSVINSNNNNHRQESAVPAKACRKRIHRIGAAKDAYEKEENKKPIGRSTMQSQQQQQQRQQRQQQRQSLLSSQSSPSLSHNRYTSIRGPDSIAPSSSISERGCRAMPSLSSSSGHSGSVGQESSSYYPRHDSRHAQHRQHTFSSIPESVLE